MNRTRILNVATIVLLIAGVCLLFYPAINNIIFVYKQNQVISDYNTQIVNLDEQDVKVMEEEAQKYNDSLASAYVEQSACDQTEQPVSSNLAYSQLLNISEEQMGYIVIPKISLNQPVYHGTDDAVLDRGIGHMENTSLPVGGENTHAVLTGHTGVPGMMLFTDLEKMEVGDKFYIKTLNKTLAYEVDNIRVVLPNVTEYFRVIPREDLVTLVTCTPYGVNSHRLLVRGTRVPYNGEIDDLNKPKLEETTPHSEENPQSTADDTVTATKYNKFSKQFILYYVVIPAIVSVVLVFVLVKVLKNRKNKSNKFTE